MHLEDVLAHFEPKWHAKEPISSLVNIESGQERAGFIQMDTPEPIFSIKFEKNSGSTQAMRDLIQSWSLVIFS